VAESSKGVAVDACERLFESGNLEQGGVGAAVSRGEERLAARDAQREGDQIGGRLPEPIPDLIAEGAVWPGLTMWVWCRSP